ncbi:MAG: pitrilysin family protein [Snowella sp.]|nr:pitrilysin family protein [Snowella sp.]
MMKKLLKRFCWLGLVTSALTISLTLHSPATAKSVPLVTAQAPLHYDQLQLPPLPDIQIPNYERYQLSNGLVVYLVEDRELPLIKGTAVFRTGSRLEPGNQAGLAGITGITMRTGGTQKRSADELNQILEQRAAAIETSIGTSSGSASFDALSKDKETVLNLFAEIIQSPAFAADKIELAKTQAQGAIARRNDNPSDIASREFSKLIYGNQSPYARTIEYATLAQINRDDIIKFHQTYIRPEETILGIVGDFDRAEMKALIEKNFGNWVVSTPKPKLAVPNANQQNQQKVFLADLPKLTQSTIFLGHLGGQLNDPDYPALTVMNGVLNGFGGRLFNDIRSRQGLAYSVYGSWNAAYDYPGVFVGGGQTRTDATIPFIESFLKEIDRIRTSPVSPSELSYAKESILNSFVFKFENPSQTLTRLMTYEYYGYPADFIFQYQNKVKNVTADDIQRVAQKYLTPDKIITLIVGNGKEIQPKLNNLGKPVGIVDVTIPNSPKSPS